MVRLLLFVCLAVSAAAQPRTETGELNGAAFRIDIPEQWSGGLIVYMHGYAAAPGRFDNPKPNPLIDLLTGEGHAVAQSGYAAGGWAIEEAIQDTEALRRYFLRKYGAPKETWVTGHSMGGFLTMTLMERFPHVYDGGLPLCGPLSPASYFMQRRVFDMMVVFGYLFPSALPSPAQVPADYAVSPARNVEILNLLESNPAKAEDFRRFSGIRTNKEAAATAVFFTYILKDLQQRSGGNPFDNTGTIYEGTSDDDSLNVGVKRYEADPRASEYVRRHYTPSGRISNPVLAIHNTYDPLVPPWTTNPYALLTAAAGRGHLFIQRYVKRPGHCAITPEETVAAFRDLRRWKESGQRP
jgi:pimeloyl-ACP methyl ester carboxylesterase